MKTPQLPHPTLAAALGATTEVWLKREDLHPLGSHKGRSIPVMLHEHVLQGAREFVISSSGNAALAAAGAVAHHNKNQPTEPLTLTIFVGNKIAAHKLARLQTYSGDRHIVIEQSERPKQAALQRAQGAGVINLRQSTDEFATLGYHELAAELLRIPHLSAVFVPTSSGTTAQGLFEGFALLKATVAIHIAQTPSCHPFVEATPIAEESVATAIVDNVAHRKNQIARVITESHGSGYVITNAEIIAAQTLIKNNCNFEASPNSALSVAALAQALKNPALGGASGAVVCLITGA